MSELPRRQFIFHPEFRDRVQRLQERLAFLEQNNVDLSADDRNRIRSAELFGLPFAEEGRGYAPGDLRPPTLAEWDLSDTWLSVITRYDTDELRRRVSFRTYGRQRVVSVMRIAVVWSVVSLLAGVVLGALVGGLSESSARIAVSVVCFCSLAGWALFTGRAGAAASLSLNILSIRHDLRFDISDDSLVKIHIWAGSLFGVLFSLLLCVKPYAEFIQAVIAGNAPAPARSSLLLLPFLLGFSASLVTTIIQQALRAVQAFLNIAPESSHHGPAGGPRTPENGAAAEPAPNRPGGRGRGGAAAGQGRN